MKLLESFYLNKITLTTIFNSFSEGLWILNNEKQVVYTNAFSQGLFSSIKKNMPNDQWIEELEIYYVNQRTLLPYEEYPIILALNGLIVKEYKLYIKNKGEKDGLFLSVNAVPLKDKQGEIQGAMATFRDITRAVIRERKIVEDRAFYQKLIDHIPAGILVKDLEGKYIFTNKMSKEAFPEIQLKGKTVFDLVPYETARKVNEENNKALAQKSDTEYLVDLPLPDGSLGHYRMINFPTFDNGNNLSGLCIIAFDETQKVEHQKIIEAERIKSINASKLAALGTLAAEIGHEINNPLGIIKTSLIVLKSMLKDSESLEEIYAQIDVIDQTTNRITDIVGALKHVSRDSSNEEISTCSLEEILKDVRALCQTKFKIKGIKLDFDISKVDLSIKVNCLRVQVSQVLLNVLMNACDAIENLNNPWIKVILIEDETNFLFKILDSGPGIATDIQDKIFDPFFTTKGIGEGTGLGLSIAKDIMLRQSGDIYLDPSEAASCFIIKLPKSAPP